MTLLQRCNIGVYAAGNANLYWRTGKRPDDVGSGRESNRDKEGNQRSSCVFFTKQLAKCMFKQNFLDGFPVTNPPNLICFNQPPESQVIKKDDFHFFCHMIDSFERWRPVSTLAVPTVVVRSLYIAVL